MSPSCPSCGGCPLCGGTGPHVAGLTARGRPRRFRACPDCGLLFIDPRDHLSVEEERARYRLHENRLEDEGYVRFLDRLLDPVLSRVEPGRRGLDYGCGSARAAARRARSRGFECDAFDPHFTEEIPVGRYDFVLVSEVFEHFRDPAVEIERLCGFLAPGGILGVMTERWVDLESVPSWHYVSDPTHVCFYHAKTFEFLARRHHWERLFDDGVRVAVYRTEGRPENPS